ncbi:MAG: hypothetical protein HYZ68_02935 [Chloroflexi bacterium]|nr:hypothetical protein [Chloroflexota bacterium]
MLRGGLQAGLIGGIGLIVLGGAATMVASLVPTLAPLYSLLNCFALLVLTMAVGSWAPRLSGGRVATMGGGLLVGALAGALAFGIRAAAQVSAALAMSYFLGGVVAASPVGTYDFSFPGQPLGPVEAMGITCLAGGLIAMVGAILGGTGGLLYQALLAPEVGAPASPSTQQSSR